VTEPLVQYFYTEPFAFKPAKKTSNKLSFQFLSGARKKKQHALEAWAEGQKEGRSVGRAAAG
jgi:hypothetical protein